MRKPRPERIRANKASSMARSTSRSAAMTLLARRVDWLPSIIRMLPLGATRPSVRTPGPGRPFDDAGERDVRAESGGSTVEQLGGFGPPPVLLGPLAVAAGVHRAGRRIRKRCVPPSIGGCRTWRPARLAGLAPPAELPRTAGSLRRSASSPRCSGWTRSQPRSPNRLSSSADSSRARSPRLSPRYTPASSSSSRAATAA